MSRLFIAILAVLCVVAPAQAQQDDTSFELTPFGGFRFGGTFEIEESPESYDI